MEKKLCPECGLIFDVDDCVLVVDTPMAGVTEDWWGCPECGSIDLWNAPGGEDECEEDS